MSALQGIFTDQGLAKEATSLADGTSFKVSEIAWGNGIYVPSGSETELASELGRMAVQGVSSGADANEVTFLAEVDGADGPFLDISEVGLFDEAGVLIAIGQYAEPWDIPLGFTATIGALIVFSNAQAMTIEITNGGSFALSAIALTAGVGLTGGGNLTEDRSFAVDFANAAEVDSGASVEKAISPATLRHALDGLIGGAPEALNTLSEIAAAIANDENYSATVANLLKPTRARRAYLGGR